MRKVGECNMNISFKIPKLPHGQYGTIESKQGRLRWNKTIEEITKDVNLIKVEKDITITITFHPEDKDNNWAQQSTMQDVIKQLKSTAKGRSRFSWPSYARSNVIVIPFTKSKLAKFTPKQLLVKKANIVEIDTNVYCNGFEVHVYSDKEISNPKANVMFMGKFETLKFETYQNSSTTYQKVIFDVENEKITATEYGKETHEIKVVNQKEVFDMIREAT